MGTLQAKNYDDARIEVERLARKARESAQVYLLKGRAYLGNADPSAIRTSDTNGIVAIRSFLQAVRLEPNLVEAHRPLMAYYSGQRNWTDAATSAKEIQRATPDDPAVNYVLARWLVEAKKPNEARVHLDVLLARERPLRPRTAVLAAALGELAEKDGSLAARAEEALSEFSRRTTPWETIEDRIAMVELRSWKSRRSATPSVVRQITASPVTQLTGQR